MATVNSEIEVARLTCDLLKETPLASFEDNTPVGRWLKRNFPIVRNIILAQTPWGFAIKRKILQRSETNPEYGWQAQFVVPNDCLRILPLRVGGKLDGRLINYEREGSYILTDFTQPLKVRYIFEQIDATTWSPLFVDALSTAIAIRMSQWLTGKNSFTEMMKTLHDTAMTAAIFANGAEGTAAQTTGTYYDDVRYDYGSGIRYVGSDPTV